MTETSNRRTAAVRWLPTEPFAHLDDIHRRMNQLMHGLAVPPIPPGDWWTPAVDIEETDEECVVEIDLPGASANDVVVDFNDRFLTVHGQIPAREHTGVLRRHTRMVGPLRHTFELPCSVRGDRITATLTNGVLTVRAPKAHPGPARRIHIVDSDDPGGAQP